MIDKLIRDIAKRGQNTQCFECVVVSVDKENDTCTLKPADEDMADLKDARLTANIDTKTSKLVVYPAVDSTVVVMLLNDMKTEVLIIAYSEVEEIRVDCEKVVMNGGELGGLVKINYLLERLQAMEIALNTHTHVVAGSAAALNPAAIATFTTLPLLEDTKIKH